MGHNDYVCPKCKQSVENTTVEFRCKLCGLTFPVVDGIPDFFISDSKDEEIDEPNQTWLDPAVVETRGVHYDLIVRALKGMTYCIQEIVSRTGERSRILEVGMGTAHFTRWLAEDAGPGTQIFAFDFSWPIIQVARVNTHGFHNVRLFRANARGALPFKDESFDVILLRLSPLGAHGTPNVQAGYQLLKPGGWYFEAGWERTCHPTSPTEWAIQHGYESAEAHEWQYWRNQTRAERDAARIELEHLAAQGCPSAARILKQGIVTRSTPGRGDEVQVMTKEHLLVAQKPQIK